MSNLTPQTSYGISTSSIKSVNAEIGELRVAKLYLNGKLVDGMSCTEENVNLSQNTGTRSIIPITLGDQPSYDGSSLVMPNSIQMIENESVIMINTNKGVIQKKIISYDFKSHRAVLESPIDFDVQIKAGTLIYLYKKQSGQSQSFQSLSSVKINGNSPFMIPRVDDKNMTDKLGALYLDNEGNVKLNANSLIVNDKVKLKFNTGLDIELFDNSVNKWTVVAHFGKM